MTTSAMHDTWGWFTTDPAFSSRPAPEPSTPYGTGPVEGQPWPNWTGYEWQDMTYAPPEPVVVTPPVVVDPCEWLIDIGPFFDRFGAAKLAVLTSADATVKAILQDIQVRKWIDLKRADVASSLAYVGTKVPSVDATLQAAILNTPVAAADNLALRKMFFA